MLLCAVAICWSGSTSAIGQTVDYDGQAQHLYASAKFRAMKEELSRGYDQIVGDMTTLTQIPAPPFQETAKGQAFAAMLRTAGLSSVTIDAVGNVVGLRKGIGSGPTVVVAAHLDTVFPPGTNVMVMREGNRLLAPGIADDSCSLAVLLALKGTSVNSIPISVKMDVDMRSEGQESLDALEKTILAIPKAAVDRENAVRSTKEGHITYALKSLGDRPVGHVADTAPITRVAVAAGRAAGLEPTFQANSTDANLPMSLGIQAVSLASGFEASRMHSLDENLVLDKPKNIVNMTAALATLLLLAGTQ
jgi:acetylornithine deacetylase/succinyl-diaminopimelate desuccinylase-like protein